jgi:hypothetical protein
MQEHPAIQAVCAQLLDSQPRDIELSLQGLAILPIDLNVLPGPEVLHVAAAMEQGLLDIEELPAPTVPSVKVLNRADLPVFFPAGVVLRGGAQTRIVATPTLVMPGMTVEVAVRCVEAGRWSTHSDRRFRGVSSAPERLKRSKARRDSAARESRGVRASDQTDTWQEVTVYLETCRVHSPSESLQDAMEDTITIVLEKRNEMSEEEKAQIQAALEGAQGVAITRHPEGLVALDLFGTPDLAEHGVPMAVDSVEIEAGNVGRAQPTEVAASALLDAVRKSVLAAAWTVREEGTGTLIDFSTPAGAQGTAFVYQEHVLQTSLSWA